MAILEQAPNAQSTGAGGFVLSMPRYNAGINQATATPESRKGLEGVTDIDFFAGAEGIGNFGGFAIDTPEYQEYQTKFQEMSDFVNTAIEKKFDPRVVDMGSKDSWEINKEYRARLNELKQLGNKLHFARPVEQEMLKSGMLYDINAPIGADRYMGAVQGEGLTNMSKEISKGVSSSPYEAGVEFNSAAANYNDALAGLTSNYEQLRQQFANNPVALKKIDQDYQMSVAQLQRPTMGNQSQRRSPIDDFILRENLKAQREEQDSQNEFASLYNSYKIFTQDKGIKINGGDFNYPTIIIDAKVSPSASKAWSVNLDKALGYSDIELDRIVVVPVRKDGSYIMPKEEKEPNWFGIGGTMGINNYLGEDVAKFEIVAIGKGKRKSGTETKSDDVIMPVEYLTEKLSGNKKKAAEKRVDDLRGAINELGAEKTTPAPATPAQVFKNVPKGGF